jgi:hypothetical protein
MRRSAVKEVRGSKGGKWVILDARDERTRSVEVYMVRVTHDQNLPATDVLITTDRY